MMSSEHLLAATDALPASQSMSTFGLVVEVFKLHMSLHHVAYNKTKTQFFTIASEYPAHGIICPIICFNLPTIACVNTDTTVKFIVFGKIIGRTLITYSKMASRTVIFIDKLLFLQPINCSCHCHHRHINAALRERWRDCHTADEQ